jgi:hypothetical protein
MFKVGDKVVCIESGGSAVPEFEVKKGTFYTVSHVEGPQCRSSILGIKEMGGKGYYQRRFEVIGSANEYKVEQRRKAYVQSRR